MTSLIFLNFKLKIKKVNKNIFLNIEKNKNKNIIYLN